MLNTPIERATIAEMSDDEIDKLVNEIRQRRMRLYEQYVDAANAKREKKSAAIIRRMNHALDMFVKDLERADRALEKLEKRAMVIHVHRMELGENVVMKGTEYEPESQGS